VRSFDASAVAASHRTKAATAGMDTLVELDPAMASV
jgi:hypothetical protein